MGGTFTELAAVERLPGGGVRIIAAKTDTTPPDCEKGVLEIARGNRPDVFNLAYVKPAPFVPRHLRAELPGRMDYHGRGLVLLDLSGRNRPGRAPGSAATLGSLFAEAGLPGPVEIFRATHEREYTYRLPAAVELVGIHLIASAGVGKPDLVPQPLTDAPASTEETGRRTVNQALEGTHRATIHDGDRLRPGMTLQGPAIIEESGTTIVLHPGNRARMDEYRNLHITL